MSTNPAIRKYTHIQKDHFHNPRSASTPPSTGPIPILTPNALTNNPKKSGRRDNGTVFVTTAKEPCINPAAPHPTIALATMKSAEEGAIAQSTLPTIYPISNIPSSHSLSFFRFEIGTYTYLQTLPQKQCTTPSHSPLCTVSPMWVAEL